MIVDLMNEQQLIEEEKRLKDLLNEGKGTISDATRLNAIRSHLRTIRKVKEGIALW